MADDLTADITLKECTEDHSFERWLFGAWWWQATIGLTASRSGFARTREKAQAKAEKAARKLAAVRRTEYEKYRYEVKPHGDQR